MLFKYGHTRSHFEINKFTIALFDIDLLVFYRLKAKGFQVKMVFMNRVVSRMLVARGFATSARRQEVHPAYAQKKINERPFQINNGKNVSTPF